ncbi:MAG: sigma-E processing peptidase SpoIIGA [Bacillota bacterium]
MAGYVVYLDQVFLGNLLMNYLILWSAGRLSNARTCAFRLALAAGLGSLYSLLTFLPGTGFLFSLPCKLLFSVLMVLAAFAPLSWRALAACVGFFYVSSFALGGMVLGFTYLLHTNAGFFREMKEIPAVIGRHFWSGVLLTLLFGWTAYRLGAWVLRRRWQQRRFKIAISFFGRRVDVDALVDTGNSLVDPLTGDPVIVVEYEAVKAVLPAEIQKTFEENQLDYTRLLADLTNTPWAARFRVIPFQSLGQQHGLLAGLRPDVVEIEQGSRKIKAQKVIVGIYRHRLHSGENYRALLHPALLEAA